MAFADKQPNLKVISAIIIIFMSVSNSMAFKDVDVVNLLANTCIAGNGVMFPLWSYHHGLLTLWYWIVIAINEAPKYCPGS